MCAQLASGTKVTSASICYRNLSYPRQWVQRFARIWRSSPVHDWEIWRSISAAQESYVLQPYWFAAVQGLCEFGAQIDTSCWVRASFFLWYSVYWSFLSCAQTGKPLDSAKSSHVLFQVATCIRIPGIQVQVLFQPFFISLNLDYICLPSFTCLCLPIFLLYGKYVVRDIKLNVILLHPSFWTDNKLENGITKRERVM